MASRLPSGARVLTAAEPGRRQRLGNSADVSKGLRQLHSKGRIARSGKGGRQGPFQYTAKCACLPCHPLVHGPHTCSEPSCQSALYASS